MAVSDRWIEAGRIRPDETPKFVVEKYLQFMYEGDARMEAPVLEDVAIFKSILPALAPGGMLSMTGARVEFFPERC
jgi:hypothetical protein